MDSADTAADVETFLTVGLLPEAPGTADALQVSVDHDETVSDLAYAWYRDNLLVAGLDSALVPAENTARDEVWRVVVTPDRGGGSDQPVSAKVTIGNTAPEVTSVSFTADADVTTDLAVTVESQDADGDAVTHSYAWSVDGDALDVVWGGSIPAGTATRDQVVTVEVTPSDGTDDGAPLTAEITIGNSPPSVALATLGVTTAVVDTTLEVVTDGWYDADGDSEGYSYAWFVDGEEVGSDSPTYTPESASLGLICWCQVTPTDGADDGEPVLTEMVAVVEGSE